MHEQEYSDVKQFKLLTDLLTELKMVYWLADADPSLTPSEREDTAAMFWLTLAERQRVSFKILVPVPDRKKVGWAEDVPMRGAVLRRLVGDVEGSSG